MIFGLHPLFGFLPLLLYIVLMLMGKDMNVSVLLCVILGAILTGETITIYNAYQEAGRAAVTEQTLTYDGGLTAQTKALGEAWT